MDNQNIIRLLFILLIFMIAGAILIPIDPQLLLATLFFFGPIVIYFVLMAFFLLRLIDRKGYELDIDSLFAKGVGKMIIEDGSSHIKLLSLSEKQLVYSQYYDPEEIHNSIKAIFYSVIIAPIFSWLLFTPVAYYRIQDKSFIIVLNVILGIIFLAFIIIFLLVKTTVKINTKKEIQKYVTITKIQNNRVRVVITIQPQILVKHTIHNKFVFELHASDTDAISTSTLTQEFNHNKKNIAKIYQILFALQSKLLIYPQSMKIEFTDPRIIIKEYPEYKPKFEGNSVLFLSTTDDKLAPLLHTHVKAWIAKTIVEY